MRDTVIIDSRKKLAAYLRELAAEAIKRECKINALEEVVSEAWKVADRMPSGWKSRAKRALAM